MPTELSPVPTSRFVIYADKNGDTRLDVRFDNQTVWLTQLQMATLFQVSVPNINVHIRNIIDEGELTAEATIKDFLIVRQEGSREVARQVAHYNLDMIISVGYRVTSLVATRFRIWATQILREYITKGFALDDERLKTPGGIDYFDELNRRIRAIRASEQRFYQKVRDLFVQTSVDYDKSSRLAQTFFATIQNKLLFAVTGHTAAEIITARCATELMSFGLTTWPAERPSKVDAMVAKNYLTEAEVTELDTLVEQFLAFAESQASRHLVTSMADWVEATNALLTANRYSILAGPGSVSHHAMETLVSHRWSDYDANRRAMEHQRAIEVEVDDLRQLVASQQQITQAKAATSD